MVRVGGIAYAIDVAQPMGRRISQLRLQRTGAAINPAHDYVVAGWGSVNENTQGLAIWDVVAHYVAGRKVVTPGSSGQVTVAGG